MQESALVVVQACYLFVCSKSVESGISEGVLEECVGLCMGMEVI